MNKKGFILVDSLICVLITCSISFLCFGIYESISKDEEVFENYEENENQYYEELFEEFEECEACRLDESD